MRILVTGGAGYLGSVLIPRLLNGKLSALISGVTVVDLFLHGENSLAGCYSDPRLTVRRADLRNDDISSLVKTHDTLVLLHGIVGMPACKRNPLDAHLVNLKATLSIRDMLNDQNVIYPATNSSYGKSGNEPVTEDAPLNPLSLYARDKVAAESALLKYEGTTSLRFATLYGMAPRMRYDLLVNDFVLQAVRGQTLMLYEPEQKRCFLHVRDAAAAIEFAILHKQAMCGQAYNVVGDNITKHDLWSLVRDQVKSFDVYSDELNEDPDQRDYFVSSKKIRALGYSPCFTLRQGIAELIRGYQAIL